MQLVVLDVGDYQRLLLSEWLLLDEAPDERVRGVTDLMVMPGLINLDFADIRAVMSEMGKAMMGTGEAEGERRAIEAASLPEVRRACARWRR